MQSSSIPVMDIPKIPKMTKMSEFLCSQFYQEEFIEGFDTFDYVEKSKNCDINDKVHSIVCKKYWLKF